MQRTIDGQAIQRLPQTNAEELDVNPTSTAPSRYAHDFSGIPVHAQRQTGAEKLIQRRTSGDTHVETAPPNTQEVLRASGQALDTVTRAFMEPRFGHDFSRVRVHLDSQAAESARDVGALAYTVGRDIVFSEGQFAPYSAAGQQLLAHELAHTVQQSAGGGPVTAGNLRVAPANDPLEHDAERASAAALSARVGVPFGTPAAAALRSGGGPMLRRQPSPDPHRPETPTNKEEGGEKTSTPTEAPCKLPGAPLPCSPKGVSIDDFLKKNPPRDALGVTKYGQQKFANPEVVTKPTGKDKAVVIQKTKATQISCESFFAKADDKKTISRTSSLDAKNPKQEKSAEQCGGHYSEEVRIFPEGEDRIREAEMEHCRDYRYAFDISLGCYADVVNDFAKKRTPFTSPEAAVEAVAASKRVGLKPDTWVKRYFELLDKSNDRDTNGWHTAVKSGPLQLSVKGRQCQSDFPNEIKRKSYPEVGKHRKEDVIK